MSRVSVLKPDRMLSSTTASCWGAVVWLLLLPFCGCKQQDDSDHRSTAAVVEQKSDELQREPTASPTAEPSHSLSETNVPARQFREQTLQQIPGWFDRGEFAVARSKLRELLVTNPQDIEVLLWHARIEDAAGNSKDAVEILSNIPPDDPDYGLMTLGTSADWLVKLGRYDEAIERYLQILKYDPSITIAHRQLASLLNRMGRRQQAMPHLRALCSLGDITQSELASMISRQDASSTQPVPSGNEPQNAKANPWLSPVAEARLRASQGEFDAALEILSNVCSIDHESNSGMDSGERKLNRQSIDPTAVALLGRIAADHNDEDAIVRWRNLVDDVQTEFADHWYTLARLAMNQHQSPEHVAALLSEAVLRDPTDWVAFGLLENCMNQLERSKAETVFRLRTIAIKRSILASNAVAGGDSAAFARLAVTLETLGRPLEANAWRMVEQFHTAEKDEQAIAALRRHHHELQQSGHPFASDSFVLGEYSRHAEASGFRNLVLSRLGRAESDQQRAVENANRWTGENHVEEPRALRFSRRANDVGLRFEYHNANPRKERDLQIYEQFGGGVAALDFDRDGRVDYYFAQSAGSPLNEDGVHANCLYSQKDSQFVNVTESASADDRGYGLGVGVGDLNQDGFDDLIVCNFGRNSVLINQGDGTFHHASLGGVWNENGWTSSIAVADLNGDALPDVMEVNYLDDPAVFTVPSRNEQGRYSVFRGPESYRPAIDRMLFQNQDQSWSANPLSTQETASPGLGVVIADFDRNAGNECFVSNDTRPNSLWTRENSVWNDVAKLRGCAYSARGGSGASMGIAAADFDQNGQLDLHVTNFYNEPVHFYKQQPNGMFVDSVVAANLHRDSMPVLGFGTTAIDFQNDGEMDLAVLNGHIEDLRFRNAPFKMKPQLFAQHAGRFELQSASDLSQDHDNYFATPSLGRGLIRTDWNRDGRVDLLATHLDAPVELIENQTADTGNWLQFELVGVRCERSAVGAVITVQTERGSKVEWLDSGDGYSCSDERIVFFGLGDSENVEQVTVQWPDGTSDQLSSVSLNQRVLVVQGQTDDVRKQE